MDFQHIEEQTRPMVNRNDKLPTETIGKLIDRIEKIREELVAIQGAMEKLEQKSTHLGKPPTQN